MTIPFYLPKVQMATALILILISDLLIFPSTQTLLMVILAIVLTLGFDSLFLKLRKIKLFFLSAALISGLIIALLYDPKLPVIELITVCALAMLGKNFIRIGGKHIFNPAGFGLFLTGMIFQHNVSWWAVSFQQLDLRSIKSVGLFLILIIPAYVSMYRMRRFRAVLSFLVVFTIISSLLRQNFELNSITSIILDPTVVFFSLVMLPEPMTTPASPINQILYGVSVAIISTMISLPILGSRFIISSFIPDGLIFGLLIGNLVFFGNGKFFKLGKL